MASLFSLRVFLVVGPCCSVISLCTSKHKTSSLDDPEALLASVCLFGRTEADRQRRKDARSERGTSLGPLSPLSISNVQSLLPPFVGWVMQDNDRRKRKSMSLLPPCHACMLAPPSALPQKMQPSIFYIKPWTKVWA